MRGLGRIRTPLSLGVITCTVAAAVAAAPLAANAEEPAAPTGASQQAARADLAAPSSVRERKAAADEIVAARRTLAKRFAAALVDPRARRAVQTQLAADPAANVIGALDGLPAGRSFTEYAGVANQRVLELKGVPESQAKIFEVKLWDAAMAAKVARGVTPLVAYRPAGEDRESVQVEAFDRLGKVRTFDANRVPNVPVIVVDLDLTAVNQAVFGKVRQTLAGAGVTLGETPAEIPATSHTTKALAPGVATAAAASYTVIERARLGANGDREGVGDAEMYTLVIGVGTDDRPRMDGVWMPWLTTDQQLYAPNQPVVDWSHFKHGAVSLVMMEQDGTNYKDVVMAVVSAIGAIVDFAYPYLGGVGSLAANIVNAIIKALPDEWFIDDDDYADSWNLVTQNGNGLQHGVVRDSWLILNRHDVVDGVDVAAPLGAAPAVGKGYVIESRLNTSKVLDSGDKQPVQWGLHGSVRQQWKVQRIPNGGGINLVSMDTGKCLAMPAAGTTAVTLAVCDASVAQQWRFTKKSPDGYALISEANRQVLSIQDGSTAEGTGLVAADDHGFLSQQWRFIEILK